MKTDWFMLLIGIALGLGACSTPTYVPPDRLISPYDVHGGGEPLWAIAPLRNETGTLEVDPLRVSDRVAYAVTEAEGLAAKPVNSTLQAMRALGMEQIATPDDARALATAMGVDGIVLGSITAWDPYDPPRLGIALALYVVPGHLDTGRDGLDPRTLEMSYSDYSYFRPTTTYGDAPDSVVNLILDASRHDTLFAIQEFASGRHDPETALGWEIYVRSMDRFTEFAAQRAVRLLLDAEWMRLSRETGRR